MKLWIDCEYNSFKGELISMALVDENDEFFYEVLPYHDMKIHPWVKYNVIPVLHKEATTRSTFVARLEKFLAKYDSIHIVADWPEDIAHFCDVLITGPGMRINTPPMTMEVVRVDGGSAVPNNALMDARGLKEACVG